MADIDLQQGRILPRATVRRWVDVGGGIHALLLSVDGSTISFAEGSTVALAEGTAVGLAAGAGVMFIDESGTAYGIKHVDNKPRVSSMPYTYDISEGNVADHTAVRQFGHNPDVGTAWEAVSHIGAVMYYPTADETLIVKSDDTDDDGAPVGAGARTIYVNGLNDAWAVVEDTITLNGTTAVNFNTDMFRVNYLEVLTVGASGTNEGEITVYGADGTSKIMSIENGEGVSHSASYSVPAGVTFYLVDQFISDASLKGANIALFVRELGGLWHLQHGFQILTAAVSIPTSFPEPYTEKTDLEWRAKAKLAGADVGVKFSGWTE